jgi:REP-associated tyrosine transposase
MLASFYKRNLPHWHPEGRTLFITWRLFGSLPAGIASVRTSELVSPDRKFRDLDATLDKASIGPLWLKDERIASCVVQSLLFGEAILKQYAVHAYVIMPNHVHLLLEPWVEVRRIMQGIKGTTSRKANKLLSRPGRPFWQDESFDHWIRSAGEFLKIRNYILQNPVSAGLAKNVLDWPWSSASTSQEGTNR